MFDGERAVSGSQDCSTVKVSCILSGIVFCALNWRDIQNSARVSDWGGDGRQVRLISLPVLQTIDNICNIRTDSKPSRTDVFLKFLNPLPTSKKGAEFEHWAEH